MRVGCFVCVLCVLYAVRVLCFMLLFVCVSAFVCYEYVCWFVMCCFVLDVICVCCLCVGVLLYWLFVDDVCGCAVFFCV